MYAIGPGKRFGKLENTMKKLSFAMILASLLVSPLAHATGAYGGLSLGQVQYDGESNDTANFGIQLGNINEHGIGYELFYSLTLIDDSETSGGFESAIETDTLGFYAVYKTPGKVYFKAKAGYGMVFFNWDIREDDVTVVDLDDTFEGFSYGVSVGTQIGDGQIELSYYRFPDFDDFEELEDAVAAGQASVGITDEVDIEFDIEMFNLSYIWTF